MRQARVVLRNVYSSFRRTSVVGFAAAALNLAAPAAWASPDVDDPSRQLTPEARFHVVWDRTLDGRFCEEEPGSVRSPDLALRDAVREPLLGGLGVEVFEALGIDLNADPTRVCLWVKVSRRDGGGSDSKWERSCPFASSAGTMEPTDAGTPLVDVPWAFLPVEPAPPVSSDRRIGPPACRCSLPCCRCEEHCVCNDFGCRCWIECGPPGCSWPVCPPRSSSVASTWSSIPADASPLPAVSSQIPVVPARSVRVDDVENVASSTACFVGGAGIDLRVNRLGSLQIRLTWDPVVGANEYVVLVCDASQGPCSPQFLAFTADTAYTDTSTDAGMIWYRVDAAGLSPQPGCVWPENYCKVPEGACVGAGVCSLRPDYCLAVWDPVCGCNGTTYSNRCYAAAAGVNVRRMGSCTL